MKYVIEVRFEPIFPQGWFVYVNDQLESHHLKRKHAEWRAKDLAHDLRKPMLRIEVGG